MDSIWKISRLRLPETIRSRLIVKITTRRLAVLCSALSLSLMMSSVLADELSIDERATQITNKHLLTDTHIDVP